MAKRLSFGGFQVRRNHEVQPAGGEPPHYNFRGWLGFAGGQQTYLCFPVGHFRFPGFGRAAFLLLLNRNWWTIQRVSVSASETPGVEFFA